MLIVSDYECMTCGEVFEKFAKRDADVQCISCGGKTKKCVTAPRFKLEGVSGDFPGAAMKWTREHQKAAKK
jgi:putative FmdB family regulatory protein